MEEIRREEPPEGCHHYYDTDDIPEHTRKYYSQRYDLFSRYDEGIWMTEDGWYGVTPEAVANSVAQDVSQYAPPERTAIIDTFAGMGGNAIAFALSGRWERVFAIEKDAHALACAKHNAAVYGVSNKIWWIHGDCFTVLKKQLAGITKTAIIFASPPWGGPGYLTDAVFNLNLMEPYNLQALYQPFSKLTSPFVLYLPRTSDLNQLAKLSTPGTRLPVTHYCMRGHSKALCVYFGHWLES